MRLTFLGSGGSFCDFRVNYQNNAIVETDDGLVLLDCGVTALQSMREIGIRPSDIRAVLITHLHADHASPAMLIGERYYHGADGSDAPGYLATPILAPADVLDPLLASIAPYVDDYQDRGGVIRPGGTKVLVEPKATTEVEIGGTSFRFFRVPHVVGADVDKPAYGLEIRDRHAVFAWSGDTVFNREWIERTAPRVDTLFHECTFAGRSGATVHTHWPDLLTLPAEVRSRIVLMHHNAVPDGVDVSSVRGAAARHQSFGP